MQIAKNVEIAKSCEDKNKTYVTYPDGLRLIFDCGIYSGWYICK